MKNLRIKYRLLLFLTICFSNGFSQKAADTVDFHSRKVLLFNNRTWEYLLPPDSPKSFVYREYWDTLHVFPYINEKNKADSTIADYLNSFHIKGICPVVGKIFSIFTASHPGIDIDLKTGDSVRAYYKGKVRFASYHRNGYGNLVIIRHPNGMETFYAHLSKILTDTNKWIEAGTVVGLGGSTGRSYAPHLHFETRYHDIPLNPFLFLDASKYALCLVSGHKKNPKIEKLPPEIPKQKSATYYKIKKGDTLYNISKRYGLSLDKLCEMNKITTTTMMHPGDSLYVRK